jgi:hypothetical protein
MDLGFGDMSLDGTLPRPGLPCSRGLRKLRPFPPAPHAASWPWTWVSETAVSTEPFLALDSLAPAAHAAGRPWTWVPRDMSLDGTLPRPALPCSSGLRNSRPFPPAAHAASRPLQGSAVRCFPTPGGPACTGSAALPSLPAHRAPLVRLGNTNLPFLLGWGAPRCSPLQVPA